MIRSDAEALVRKTMARFVDSELAPRAKEIDEAGEFPGEIFRRIGRMGVYGIRYPRDRGGSGGNTTLYCIICEELARGLMSVAAITAMQCLMGTNFLFHFGSPEMIEEYFLPAMRGEKVASFCLTEPEAGSDLGNVNTRAVPDGDGYRIDGMKTWVTNGPVADFFTVLCQTDPAKRLKGVNFFFIPRDTAGVSVSKPFDLLGTRTTKISELAFTDVRIPRRYMLGGEGQGMRNLMSILAEIRCMTAALAVGLQQAALNDSIRYAHERAQFGSTIGRYQMIQGKIADMATDLDASRLLTYRATRMIDEKISCIKEASMAKYFATEAACRAGDKVTRILGAYGYSMEYSAQRYYRDNRFLLYGGGTHEILRQNIARWAGL
ncbi:MAG: acyl-CoA dehydrogenase family protein [Deltaproteobacteria bacterium]|nr:acyl-CoA dehydrogenase family protein [Deltaproteobacteria bacterium]MBW1922498.1 acyl-CoA dehydrogenase family protein [Deltaproteobacteria bacterium]MBW1948317.1 acyl-CoA dehydrogenase family protein [Deltaproteobacteria bacterium]MBW2006602.1 acyl-CoA dehydrogenase family protein [Deltaproteobacteria bacterium]MBW2102288.1 acyl-CoA dehydrogenase family protein [Deltaproteobacteria bacterium]